MKKLTTKAIIAILGIGMSFYATAGNKDRTGQAGASELLINPWAQSNGLFAINTSCVSGMEAMKCNVGGLALDTALGNRFFEWNLFNRYKCNN